MERIRIVLLLLLTIFLFVQKGAATIVEPKPVFENLYVSAYEQTVLLAVINNEKPDFLQLLLANAAEMDKEKEVRFRSKLASFVKKMREKKGRAYSDEAFLKTVFYQVHHKFLKEYQPFTNFYSLLTAGAYNCLTGTALYALLLDDLGYSYRIYETDFHIFLMVETADGKEVLIDSTDPLHGFLVKKEEINQHLMKIRMEESQANQTNGKDYVDFNLKIFQPVNLREIAGLLYFNQAALQYNKQKIGQAELSVGKGRIFYPAERFEKLARFLAQQQ